MSDMNITEEMTAVQSEGQTTRALPNSALTALKKTLPAEQLDSLLAITTAMYNRSSDRRRRRLDDIVQDGNDLILVKNLLSGTWTEWFNYLYEKDLVDFSIETAQNLMAVAEMIGEADINQYKGLKPSVLYLMAQDKTPVEAVNEIKALVSEGKKVTVPMAEKIIDVAANARLLSAKNLIMKASDGQPIDNGIIKSVKDVMDQLRDSGTVDVGSETIDVLGEAVRANLEERRKRQNAYVESSRKNKVGASTSAEREYVARNIEVTVSPKGNIRLPDEINEQIQAALQQSEVVGGTLRLSLYYYKEAHPSVTPPTVNLDEGIDITNGG